MIVYIYEVETACWCFYAIKINRSADFHFIGKQYCFHCDILMIRVIRLPIIMLLILTISIFCVGAVFGGTSCPPRESIYPCTCFSVPQGRKLLHTIVSCQGLSNTDSFSTILSSLKTMEIDEFYLYDSFWEAYRLGAEGEPNQVLPLDWITLLRIKEMKIVDTTLSSCFACQSTLTCRNSMMTKFIAVNSSNTEKICSLCDTGRGDKYSWTNCLSKLSHFEFTGGKLSTLGSELFPLAMRELLLLNLSNNRIYKVDPKVFRNLPKLKSLDLSHNIIQRLDNLFNTPIASLEFLDVSWNYIMIIGPNLFPLLPALKTFNAGYNTIVHLKEDDWKEVPFLLREIDLRGNPLHCDCNVRWVNSTFKTSVVLQAHCATP
ncbi:Toll-like receptor 9, partial [Stegodyphus mimosarum]